MRLWWLDRDVMKRELRQLTLEDQRVAGSGEERIGIREREEREERVEGVREWSLFRERRREQGRGRERRVLAQLFSPSSSEGSILSE